MTPLRVYSERSFVPSRVPHVAMLTPFWGPTTTEADANRRRFDRYRAVGTSLFEMTSLEDADVAVLPFDWEFTTWTDTEIGPAARDAAQRFLDRARRAGVRVIAFYETDLMRPVPDDVTVFCPDLHRSTLPPNVFALPGWTEDLLMRYRGGELLLREKQDRPTVGFCGFAPPLATPLGKEKLKESARWALNKTGAIRLTHAVPGSYARVEAIRRLRRSPVVETNFIVRSSVIRPNRTSTMDELGEHVVSIRQREFFDNMLGSDYVLCARGFGNYSHRIYEALAVGRIPLFLDTDCVLPFEDQIDWRSSCLWVDESDLPRIGERVAAFHAELSPARFRELQVQARDVWERWISPEGFFTHVRALLEPEQAR